MVGADEASTGGYVPSCSVNERRWDGISKMGSKTVGWGGFRFQGLGNTVGWGGFGLLWARVVLGEGVLEEREMTR